MDDYYGLLGVEPDAEAATIRDAYREKKAALDAKGDKTGVAALNRAWNVLSDPYQRGRYDADREKTAEAGEPVEVVAGNEPPRRRRLFEPASRDRAMTPPAPTIEPPAGTRFPEPRKRVIAMVIDLTVLLALFIGSQFALNAILNANNEQELDQIDAINEQIDGLNDQIDELENQDPVPDDQVSALNDQVDELEDQRSEVGDKLAPTYQLMNGAFFAAGLLYLVVPSAISGSTLGKKLMGLKVVRQDGRKLGLSGAVYRYGLLVVGSYALSLLIPLLGVAIVLFIILGWMRNPNQQGMHDRFTKTLVVTEARDA